MKRLLILVLGLVSLILFTSPADGQRGGRGGGRGGGFAAGGYRGGAVSGSRGYAAGGYRAGGTINSYGGSGAAYRSAGRVVGPAGGSASAGRAGGSYTTNRGTTINYRGAAAGRTGPGGVSTGRAVGGVQVTTPGGRTATRVGSAAGATGPGGRSVGVRQGAAAASGPRGSMSARYQGGVAVGPHGAVAGGSRAGVATGPRGTVAGGSRVGVATGPRGTVVGGTRAGAAVGHYGAVAGRSTVVAGRGTYYRSRTVIAGQGVAVRRGVAAFPCYRAGWYRAHPGAWFAAGWAASNVWRAATWNSYSDFTGVVAEPVAYTFGSNVTFQDDGVYYGDTRAYSTEEYVARADTLAEAGAEAKVSKEEEWMPLGVFAMVQGNEENSNHIFQLAVNKAGVIRGNYYDAVTDTTTTVSGLVEKKTQRAAWRLDGSKSPTYEAGIVNLTRKETTMMVHYHKDRSVQYTLIRIEEPKE